MNTKIYGKPTIGCHLDHANYNVDELNCRIIAIAQGFGMELPPDDADILACYDKHSAGPHLDLSEQLNDLADSAIDWLNEQETRPYLYWANEGEANAFGLWPNIEGAMEDVGFVSAKSHADARKLGIETDPGDSTYPPAHYRGEWLHVNDHGNRTLYVRTGSELVPTDYKDMEIWSVV